jgi:hypothetical protein
MIDSDSADRLTRVVAAAIGLVLVAGAIAIARPGGGHGGVLPASLRFSAGQDGEVAVLPAAPKTFIESGPMRPGSHASGILTLRNETGERLAVGLAALPSSSALDGLARVRIIAAGRTIADSTLQALQDGTEGMVSLAPGAGTRVRVIAVIPADVETGYEGRRVSVRLVPVERRAR